MSALGPSVSSPRLAFHNKGFADARYRDEKHVPDASVDNGKAREAYLKGWRIGHRERLQAQAEGRP